MTIGSRTFPDERDRLTRILARMGGLAERAFADAILSLIRRDAELAALVVRRDGEIDGYEDEINDVVVKLLALHRPVATDLRWMIATLKIAGRVERIGDHAAGIAERVIALNQAAAIDPPRIIERMARLAQGMIKGVLDALPGLDAETAGAVRSRDGELGQLHASLIADLTARMIDDPRLVPAATHLLFIARAVTRIGDHSAVMAGTIAQFAARPAAGQAGAAPAVSGGSLA